MIQQMSIEDQDQHHRLKNPNYVKKLLSKGIFLENDKQEAEDYKWLVSNGGLDLRDSSHPRYVVAPKLLSATLDGQDVYAKINEIYGEKKNWCCRLWYNHEIFGDLGKGKKLRIDFISEDDHKTSHWMEMVLDDEHPINPPIFIPYGSFWGSETGI